MSGRDTKPPKAQPGWRTEPVSFTRRGGRLTERQQAAWEALAAIDQRLAAHAADNAVAALDLAQHRWIDDQVSEGIDRLHIDSAEPSVRLHQDRQLAVAGRSVPNGIWTVQVLPTT